MKNPNLIPYETIVRATNGEPEAVEEFPGCDTQGIIFQVLESWKIYDPVNGFHFEGSYPGRICSI